MRHPSARFLPESRFLVTACALVLLAGIQAQTKPGLTLDRILNAPQSLYEFLPTDRWIPGTHRISRIGRHDRSKVKVFPAGEGKEDVLFTADEFNAAFAAAGVKPRLQGVITEQFTWHDGNTLRVQRPEGVYHWKLGSKQARLVLPIPKGAEPIAISKGDRRLAFIRDHQLHVQVGKGEPKQVTKDGSEDIVYGGAAHRAEFGIHDGLWWSPDGRFLAFFREDLRPIRAYPYVDHTTKPPKALHGRYPMAGGKNSLVQIGIYNRDKGSLSYLSHGEEKDIYWTNATFDPSGIQLYIALVNRGQDQMDLLRFDLEQHISEGTLFSEKDKEWVEPEHGPMFLNDQTGRFLWLSPRNGYRQLYLYDAEGLFQKQVTKGRFDVQEFVGFGPGATRVYYMGSGDNPLEMHLFETDLKSGATRQITKDRGRHTCQLSHDTKFVLDAFSNLRNPGQSQVIEITTGKVRHIEKIGHRFPVLGKQDFFQVKTDSGTKLYGTTILPPDLDPKAGKLYPVLLYVYGGPHSQLVQDRWLGGSSLWLHYMATRGFVICTLDNRGTDNRGIEFSQSVFRRLSELEVKDQLVAVEFLKKLPFVDAKRIGVHGWSYGGYMTLSLMVRSPDTFACGAAGAPVTDWKQYETGYTERYMDTPKENPKGYLSSSVNPLAKNLKGRLLVIHGTDDKTVMWSHSLAFIDQCVDAGVLVDYMPYPMQKHGIRGGDRSHLYKLLTRFFVEHLR